MIVAPHAILTKTAAGGLKGKQPFRNLVIALWSAPFAIT